MITRSAAEILVPGEPRGLLLARDLVDTPLIEPGSSAEYQRCPSLHREAGPYCSRTHPRGTTAGSFRRARYNSLPSSSIHNTVDAMPVHTPPCAASRDAVPKACRSRGTSTTAN
jgi:hypothetical protein